jgi:hypothetical protein
MALGGGGAGGGEGAGGDNSGGDNSGGGLSAEDRCFLSILYQSTESAENIRRQPAWNRSMIHG